MRPPERLENGNILVPMRAEGEDGELGDGLVEIDSTHPDWEAYEAILSDIEANA